MLLRIVLFLSLVRLTNTKVAISFAQCRENHFYQDTPPVLDRLPFGDLHCICQTYNNHEYYATLYSSESRTPVYSAHRLNDMVQHTTGRYPKWRGEPQLCDANATQNMLSMGAYDTEECREKQAFVSDYTQTGFDRGHLLPNQHMVTRESRKSTFTLTNIVPQNPTFNQGPWNQFETFVFSTLSRSCTIPGADRYVVTGTVNNASSARIPQAGSFQRDIPHTLIIGQPWDEPIINDRRRSAEFFSQRELRRVVVPSQMWSAICCDSSQAPYPHNMSGWSFAYYGLNEEDPRMQVTSVEVLTRHLASHLGNADDTVLFAPHGGVLHCNFNEELSRRIENQAQNLVRKIARGHQFK